MVPAMPREKAQAAPTARPKVLMRRRGTDCLVVVLKRGSSGGIAATSLGSITSPLKTNGYSVLAEFAGSSLSGLCSRLSPIASRLPRDASGGA
jgi:hypothetical protein